MDYDEVKEYYINWVRNNSFFNEPIISNIKEEFDSITDINKLIVFFTDYNIYHTSS